MTTGLLPGSPLVTTGRFGSCFPGTHLGWQRACGSCCQPWMWRTCCKRPFLGCGAARLATDPMGRRVGGCGTSLDARRPCSCAAADRESWYCPLLWKRIWPGSGSDRGRAVATGLGERGGRFGPSGRARPGNVAAVVCRGPVGGRGSCVDGRSGGDREEPSTSSAANAADGAR